MDITLPQDIEQELAKHAEQHGTTVEDLAVATLRREFPPKPLVEEPTEGTKTTCITLQALPFYIVNTDDF